MRWPQAVAEHARVGRGYVLATVLGTTGSAPRPAGTKMVVTRDGSDDSIGGGQLEHQVCEHARALLEAGRNASAIHHFPLAAATRQCCGGSVTVLLECFAAPRLDVVVFGAGHVGRRVVALLEDLDARIGWFDTRPEPVAAGSTPCRQFAAPADVVAGLDPRQEVLILTHDHQLDYELVVALLRHGTARIGLIGSATKWQRFAARLTADGFAAAQLGRVRCPVGADLPGKQPMAVAIAIVAELLRQGPSADEHLGGLGWRQIKESLLQEGS